MFKLASTPLYKSYIIFTLFTPDLGISVLGISDSHIPGKYVILY